MAGLRQDFAYIFRRLSKSAGLVIAVIISIGLGIAANATIFSMVSRFVLKPPPVGNPSTLIALHTTHKGDRCCNNFSWPLYADVRDQSKSFSGLAAYFELLPASIGGNGEPERIWGQAATANYFDVAQLHVALGRGFLQDEEHQRVIVLGHRLWQRRFASDPAILGKAVTLSGHSFTVVGVAPVGFQGLDLILDPQFWIPLGNLEALAPGTPARNIRDAHWLAVLGRMTQGVTTSQASSELNVLAQTYAKLYSATDKDNGFYLDQAGSLPPREKSIVLLFLSALSIVVLLVLSIACANVANLLLAHAAGRQRELAIRIALGAGRGQLLRQMLLESVVLSLGGGFVGVVLSLWATSALAVFHVPAPVPLNLTLSIDWRVLVYTFVLSVGAGLLFGIVPALIGLQIATRPMIATALKGEDALARPGRRVNLRNILVVAQIAMSIVLLSATVLFLRSLERASSIDIGFRSRNLLMVSVDPRVHGFSPERTAQFLEQFRDRVAAIPGVIFAAATDSVPLSGGNRSDGMSAEGHPNSSVPIVEMYMATPGYFDTLGIPRIAGRDFANESAAAPKVAVINRVLADQIFLSENPIGQHVRDGNDVYDVIGVVGNIKSRFIGEDNRPVLFRSLAQTTASDPSFLGYTLIVHSEGSTASLLSAIRQEIHALDPAMAVYNIETMEKHLRSAFFLPRIAGTLFGVFGFIGLTLAVVGFYGVMGYSVSRRTLEIGIGIALGAHPRAVRQLVVCQGMLLTLIGLVVGLPAAWAVATLCASFLYGIRAHDTLTFVVVPFFLIAIAALACWIPAQRAGEINPERTLRYE